jgi:hypothetical protein
MPLPKYATLDNLIDHYAERSNQDNKNRERVKKLMSQYKEMFINYSIISGSANDEIEMDAADSAFGYLMGGIIQKDAKRFKKLIDGDEHFPNPWRVFFVILDIVQNEGTEVDPFDTLTRMLPSRTIMYHRWTFSWVHGEGTLISIFNRNNELVYRF